VPDRTPIPHSRRSFLQLAAGAGAAASTTLVNAAEDSPEPAERTNATTPIVRAIDADVPPAPPVLSGYQDGPQLWVRHGQRALLTYRAHPTQKYPYVFPIAGPISGLPLTSETGVPWPHHRSVFFGCDHVNGHNFWQGPIGQGQIISTGLKLGAVDKAAVTFVDTCEWRVPGQEPVLADQRSWQIAIASPRLWTLAVSIKLVARQAVQVAKTNHSLFSVRAAADLTPTGGGVLINSKGQSGEKATFGQPADWCDFHGRRGPDGPVEGIALFDHPKNPWSPSPWFTRDYGFMSPTKFFWLGSDGWRLEPGQSVTLRYCVVAHAGDPKDAALDRLFEQWASQSE
jgi:hypothetical protein